MTLGELIRSRRSALDMTMEELGDAAGISKSHVYELENDRMLNPGLHTCTRVAVALGINVQSMASALLQSHSKEKQ